MRREAWRPGVQAGPAAGLVAGVVGLAGLGLLASAAPLPAQDGPATEAEAQAEDAGSDDPRVGLGAGLFDAEHALWNMRLLANRPPPDDFVGVNNSDLAFTGDHAIQGNYNGFLIWDISEPGDPVLVSEVLCPASQGDVSVYEHLLFVSGEGLEGRLDCGTQGVAEAASEARLRGIRIFDIRNPASPRYVGNVQTCRGSHTHTLIEAPDDPDHVYLYNSGYAPVRPAEELPGCSDAPPEEDPNSSLFRIEVIRVPLEAPEEAAIVGSARFLEGLEAPPQHGPSPADLAEIERERERGAFVMEVDGQPQVLSDADVALLLAHLVRARGGEGPPTAADSAWLRDELPRISERMRAQREAEREEGPRPGPNQCHDITVYEALGLAGGACGGYGILLDITDPLEPTRIDAVADSNFAYWHSATFSNDGSAILFTDEWGGGTQPKCRADDPREWGADAIYRIEDGEMRFASYYKLPAPQTSVENCVAHNGSLIPIPGRTVMVQSWNQGGVSVFDWTDPEDPVEIAFFDRGPADSTRLRNAGSWSAYWYNGVIVNSEKARGLDVLALTPSGHLSENELEAASTVRLERFNAQTQPRLEWPASFALAGAYLDQLERAGDLPAERIAAARAALDEAEAASGAESRQTLSDLADQLEREASASGHPEKARTLAATIRELAAER